jgi:Arc/MetJ-type ribon-helix-helix transcriptional regulator
MTVPNYKSVSIKAELVDRVKQIVQQTGTYHSVSEFFSEAARLRIETIDQKITQQGSTG